MQEHYKTDHTRIELAEAVGKTIAGTGWSDGITLRFTDKTFLHINYDQYGDEISLTDDSKVDLHDAKIGGLIDQAEFDRVQAAHQAELDSIERKSYEYLKAKYGPKENL
jgi:hypothetical protein